MVIFRQIWGLPPYPGVTMYWKTCLHYRLCIAYELKPLGVKKSLGEIPHYIRWENLCFKWQNYNWIMLEIIAIPEQYDTNKLLCLFTHLADNLQEISIGDIQNTWIKDCTLVKHWNANKDLSVSVNDQWCAWCDQSKFATNKAYSWRNAWKS